MLHGMRDLEYRVLVLATLAHLFAFYGVLKLFEAPDAVILKPAHYWYYWATTVLTIGYGDLSPQSEWGRIIAPFFEFSGILILAAWLTKAGNGLTDYASKKRRGLMSTKHGEHVLVVGDYHAIRTDTLLSNAILDHLDDGKQPKVVGCFRNTGDRNPFTRTGDYHGIVPEYVQADATFNRRALQAANVEGASHIYVMCDEDATAIGIICLLSQFNVSAPVALVLREPASIEMIPECQLRLRVITPVQSALAVREMEDPGTNVVIQELVSTGRTESIHSLCIEQAPTNGCGEYSGVKASFERKFGEQALLIGFVRTVGKTDVPHIRPAGNTKMLAGDRLIYIADKDFSEGDERDFNRAVAA
jgi:voltage-gated potassium channel